MSDFWDGAKAVLSTVAPTLAAAVGGPLAGTATSAIISALGLAPDTPTTGVAAAITGATAEQLLALKKADQEFAETMAKLQLDASKLTYDDRASARGRETAVKDRTPAVMGYAILLASFGAAAAVLTGHVSDTSMQAGVVIGYLFGEARQVMGYYFGASSDGDAKTTLLYNSTPTGGGTQSRPLAP